MTDRQIAEIYLHERDKHGNLKVKKGEGWGIEAPERELTDQEHLMYLEVAMTLDPNLTPGRKEEMRETMRQKLKAKHAKQERGGPTAESGDQARP